MLRTKYVGDSPSNEDGERVLLVVGTAQKSLLDGILFDRRERRLAPPIEVAKIWQQALDLPHHLRHRRYDMLNRAEGKYERYLRAKEQRKSLMALTRKALKTNVTLLRTEAKPTDSPASVLAEVCIEIEPELSVVNVPKEDLIK